MFLKLVLEASFAYVYRRLLVQRLVQRSDSVRIDAAKGNSQAMPRRAIWPSSRQVI